jgi:tRNA1(Val) A37 N6-methylase TrmN6
LADPETPASQPDVVLTRILGGRVQLRQPRTGHKAGTDAVLLAAAADLSPGSIFADVGAGVGTVGLALALREPAAIGHLIERAGDMAALARDNVALNGLGGRVHVAAVDLFDRAARSALSIKADLVVSNPPFFAARRSRASSNPRKAQAHVLDPVPEGPGEAEAGHGAWLRAALSFLRPHGRLLLIHRPEALPELLAASEGRLGGIRIKPVQAHAGQPAIRILFSGMAGSRAPFGIADALVLHAPGGGFAPLAEAVHRGEALLPF